MTANEKKGSEASQPFQVRRSTRSAATKKRSVAEIEEDTAVAETVIIEERQEEQASQTSSSRGSRGRRARTATTSTASSNKKKRSGYVGPEKYAHLKGVPDAIDYNIICLFIGLNPGIRTAEIGHAYSHPANRFWKFLHSSGCTPDQLLPSTSDQLLPSQYALGCTNIVARPTASQAELSDEELDAGVPELERKLRKYRAEAVCIVGKGIWDSIYRTRHQGQKVDSKSFSYGWQGDEENMGRIPKDAKLNDEGNMVEAVHDGTKNVKIEENGWNGARVFVVPSTSGLVTIPQVTMKETWKQLGDWINKRREERSEAGVIVGKP